MKIRILGLLVFFFAFHLNPIFATENDTSYVHYLQNRVGFNSAEHIAAGNKVLLHLNEDSCAFDVGTAKLCPRLELSNGLKLTYGDLVALGGDFYGIPETSIALGSSAAQQEQRFINAFNSLANDPASLQEAQIILKTIQWEGEQIKNGIIEGKTEAQVYAQINTQLNQSYNCETGGGCGKFWELKQGRYLKLGKGQSNVDHFGEYALLSYQAGHRVALMTAQAAYRAQSADKKQNLLQTAYAMNGFANHFLSDGFASGHMRMPRLALYNKATLKIVALLLTFYMHDEDNKKGLIVYNQRGDRWKAFGDAYYWDQANAENRKILLEAMQASADEIFNAYSTGEIIEASQSKVTQIFPDLNKLNKDSTLNSPENSSPLFIWDSQHQKLKIRSRIDDLNQYEWKTQWIATEKLIELLIFYRKDSVS